MPLTVIDLQNCLQSIREQLEDAPSEDEEYEDILKKFNQKQSEAKPSEADDNEE